MAGGQYGKKNYRIVKQVHISFRFRVHMDDCCKF